MLQLFQLGLLHLQQLHLLSHSPAAMPPVSATTHACLIAMRVPTAGVKSFFFLRRRECLEVKCRSAVIPDGTSGTLDRTGLCLNDKSVKVKIVDTCPCVYPNNAASNARWCCGDFPHLDLSQWALEKVCYPGCSALRILNMLIRSHECECALCSRVVWRLQLPSTYCELLLLRRSLTTPPGGVCSASPTARSTAAWTSALTCASCLFDICCCAVRFPGVPLFIRHSKAHQQCLSYQLHACRLTAPSALSCCDVTDVLLPSDCRPPPRSLMPPPTLMPI